MLRQRLLTGAIAAIVTVVGVLVLPTDAVAALLLAVFLAAGWEWARLTGVESPVGRWVYLAVLAAATGGAWWLQGATESRGWVIAGSLWWVGLLIVVIRYTPKRYGGATAQYALRAAGIVTLVLAWVALVSLHALEPTILLFLLVLVWLADTAAYFSGKRFGKTQLAPELSPGKTREGVLGALLATALLAFAGAVKLELPPLMTVYFLELCLLAALFSVVGDLFESLLKRRAAVKDSGTILPGHGGVMDRVDSLLAAAPVFAFGLVWIEWPAHMGG